MQPGTAPVRRAAGPVTLSLLLLLGGLWGLHVGLAKAIGADGPRQALALLVLYVACSATGLVAMALLRGKAFRPTASMLRYFAISSAMGYLGPIFGELLVAPRIDASVFALVAGATPLATVGIAMAAGRDRLTPLLAAALAAGSASALVLLGPAAWQGEGGPGSGGPALWVALAFVVPLLYGSGDVYIEARWPRELDLTQVAAGEGVVASCWTVLLAATFGVGPADIATEAARAGWPATGLVATALAATWLYFAVLDRAGAVFVSFASYVTIATGVLAGVIVFGERPGPSLLVAGALTGLALWLLNRDRRRAAAADLEISP